MLFANDMVLISQAVKLQNELWRAFQNQWLENRRMKIGYIENKHSDFEIGEYLVKIDCHLVPQCSRF